MNSTQLFQMALGLQPPWYVDRIEFVEGSADNKELHIYLSFAKGFRFSDDAGNACPVYDTRERRWQHLNFFQHTCFLHARVPRIETSDGQIKQVKVPWARPESGFTLLFEAFAMGLIECEMPISKAAKLLCIYPNRLWKIFTFWVRRAFAADDQRTVKKVGLDETSSKKGHTYVTIAADLDARRVLFATEGKDETTVERFKEHLDEKGVPIEQIQHASVDMSPALISGIRKNFPAAKLVFDRFHIVKMLNEAMDEVRRAERKEHDALKGHKYTFLKNPKHLTDKQKIAKYELIQDFPTLGEAERLKELFNDFWDFDDKEEAMAFLSYWCDLVEDSNIQPFKKFANTIKSHWTGIINYIEAKISNGILEGINSKIQLAKRRARGYKDINNFIHMIYFIAGKLSFNYQFYPHNST